MRLDFKAFYEDKKIMHLCISKGLQVQREVVIHAGRVANVAANLMDLVSSKLKRENFKCSPPSRIANISAIDATKREHTLEVILYHFSQGSGGQL